MDEENGEAPQTIAHRMVYYVYESMAIGRDVWGVAFWGAFQMQNPDLGMDAKTLRSYFFNEVMNDAEHFAGLPYEVLQYINPMFNRIRAEVLEYRDLVENIDFVFDRDGAKAPGAVGAAAGLPPIHLRTTSSYGVRTMAPTTEQILRHVSDGLSELVWTEEEKSTKPVLTVAECLQRLAVLTQNGIPLVKCIEPGMSCYERFRQLGLTEPVVDESARVEEGARFLTPQASSTPLVAMVHAGLTSTARQDSAIGLSLREGENTVASQSRSYRTPGDGVTPNYAQALRHIRSKKRRYNT